MLCNKCGKTCKPREDAHDNEYASIEAQWGYDSTNRDFEHHQAYLCQPCYEEMIAGWTIQPEIRNMEFNPVPGIDCIKYLHGTAESVHCLHCLEPIVGQAMYVYKTDNTTAQSEKPDIYCATCYTLLLVQSKTKQKDSAS